MTLPSWSVVATVDETFDVLAAFVAHHLSLGAAHIYLYLDRDRPEVVAGFSGDPCVSTIRTDDAYWAARRPRPKTHVQRQATNALDAYQQCPTEWIMHMDGDEFLVLQPRFFRELAAIPPAFGSVRLAVTERAWVQGRARPNIFSGVVRSSIRTNIAGSELYGMASLFLNSGLAGYATCKTMHRTGRNLFPGIHLPKHIVNGKPDYDSQPHVWVSRAGTVLHFDGFTPLHWVLKLLRKAREQGDDARLADRLGAHRFAQIQAIRDAETPEDLYDLHDAIKTLPKESLGQLRALGLVSSIPIDPVGAATERYGPLDWSEAGFDRDWRAREPELAKQLGH